MAGDEDHTETYPQLIRGSLHKLITLAVDGVPRAQLLEPSPTLDISNKNNVKAFFVATSIAMGLSYSLECDEGLP